jgi:hypothetical protein
MIALLGVMIMQAIKTVGASGQVSLGKEYAGRLVMIDQVEPGVWILKLGEFVPDNERWMMQDEVRQEIDRAIEWADKNPPKETNLDELEEKVRKTWTR